jgi:RNA polymerase sigma-70 factor (ECF subfamily)
VAGGRQKAEQTGRPAASNRANASFVRLLTQHERRIYGYILKMVVDWNDADEILQETNVRLWEEFDRFEPGTDFAAWALRVAHFEVLTWRKRRQRSRLVFSEEAIASLADDHAPAGVVPQERDRAREAALAECLKHVSASNRELIQRCYSGAQTIREVADGLGRSAEAIYKRLQRLRLGLHRCIEQRLLVEDA